MKKNLLGAALAALLLGLPPSASALCTLLCSCSVDTTAVSFGTYNPISGSSVDATGNVRVTCGGIVGLLVPYEIALSTGSFSTNFSPRRMASGTNRLAYDLYTSSSHTAIWGDGSGGSQTVSGSLFLVALGQYSENYGVYGRIPGGQSTVPPGNYSDTLTVTVTYQ